MLKDTIIMMCLVMLITIMHTTIVFAQNSNDPNSEPVSFFADNLSYNSETKTVTANGNVQIYQGRRVLLAEKIIYHQADDIVEAEGSVSLIEPDGNTLFAKKARLTEGLKAGIISHFSARLADNSLLGGRRGERFSNGITVLENAAYTPCPVCRENPDKSPMWQIKAAKTTMDEPNERMSYKHARFELYGMPVFYTPYFSHPAPGAKRKSGFLMPSYKEDRNLGSMFRVPFYYSIAPNLDATITTLYTSRDGPLVDTKVRHLLPSGRYELQGSITNPSKLDNKGNEVAGNKIRGHIQGKGQFSINETWSWGFDGIRSTDDTFLQKYDYRSDNVLTSRAYAEEIDNRNYSMVEALTFQDVRVNRDPAETPLILPHYVMHKEHVSGNGSRWMWDVDMLGLSRDIGVTSRRISTAGTWEKPFILPSGHVFTLTTSVRGDAYSVDDVTQPDQTKYDGNVGRIVPTVATKWSYPLVKNSAKQSSYIEPIVMVALSPYGNNPDKIPNEDSQDVEFADDNLFAINHFTGIDRVEGGGRVSYGLRTGFMNADYGDVDVLFGQSYRTKENSSFAGTTGLSDKQSDYVGHISYKYDTFFDTIYRFRIDKDNFQTRKNEVFTYFNISPLSFTVNYLSTDEEFVSGSTSSSDSRKALLMNSALNLSDKWRLTPSFNRDLQEGEWVSARTSLWYLGDCLDLQFSVTRKFTRNRDIEPSNEYMFQFFLKNLSY